MYGRRSVRQSRGIASVLTIPLVWTALSIAPVDAQNVVVDPIVDEGLVIEVERWVELPDSSRGRPRLNMMATFGDRTFVVEEFDGLIYEIIDGASTPRPEVFLDVKAGIAASTNQELDTTNLIHGGLRSVAFHPDFSQNGLLYTTVMETRPINPSPDRYLSDAETPIAADSVLIEWTYDRNSNTVDPLSYREVFRVGMPVYDHPIKQISFNPFASPGSADYGLLYVGHGDGSVQSAIAGGGQNNDALGKVLRIDPTQRGAQPYTVPVDNPFVGDPTMIDEVWSFGHRNPHHLSFANAGGTVQLIVAEPGRDNVDEVNVITKGGNYGWSDREGTFVHLEGGGVIEGVAPLPADDWTNEYIYPAAQLGHVGANGETFVGLVIAGGYVLDNGSELDGEYLYSYAGTRGRIFHSSLEDLTSAVTSLEPRQSPSALTQATVGEASLLFDHDNDDATAALVRSDFRDVIDDDPDYDGSGRADVRLGQGPDGETYVLNKRNGWIYLITNSVAPEVPAGLTCVARDPGRVEGPQLAGSIAQALNFSSVRSVAMTPNAGFFRFVSRAGTMFPVQVRGADFLDGFSNVPCS